MGSFKKILTGLGALTLLSGCAATTASFPDSTPSKGEIVIANYSEYSILFLNSFRNTDRLIGGLADLCPGGRVEGITVTQVNRYFFGVHYDWRAVGTCVK